MMLQKILNDIRTLFSKPWMLKGADYYCTMSMGVVRFPTEGDTVEELIKKADIALYAAKCSGKNRVEFYDENVESTSFRRLDMEKICAMRPTMHFPSLRWSISRSWM